MANQYGGTPGYPQQPQVAQYQGQYTQQVAQPGLPGMMQQPLQQQMLQPQHGVPQGYQVGAGVGVGVGGMGVGVGGMPAAAAAAQAQAQAQAAQAAQAAAAAAAGAPPTSLASDGVPLEEMRVALDKFWEDQRREQMAELAAAGDNGTDGTAAFKNHNDLPLARIKRIMKSDEDVRMIRAETPVLFARACELFILELTIRAWCFAEKAKRRNLHKEDVQAAVAHTEIFDFLVEVINTPPPPAPAAAPVAAPAAAPAPPITPAAAPGMLPAGIPTSVGVMGQGVALATGAGVPGGVTMTVPLPAYNVAQSAAATQAQNTAPVATSTGMPVDASAYLGVTAPTAPPQ